VKKFKAKTVVLQRTMSSTCETRSWNFVQF